MNTAPHKRPDGKYEEKLDKIWLAEYTEDAENGLWSVDIFKHNVAEWRSIDYASLEEAQQAVHDYFDQI